MENVCSASWIVQWVLPNKFGIRIQGQNILQYTVRFIPLDPITNGFVYGPCDVSASHELGVTWHDMGAGYSVQHLDDIIVLGTDFNDTLAALRNVFIRFRQHNLKFKARKCRFFRREVKFLGKKVSGDGIAISPDKVEAVKEWPIPQNPKQLLSFLGFMNYHRSHIQSFAQVASDLYELAHAKIFIWTDRHQVSFQTLKDLAISVPLLSHPSPDGILFYTLMPVEVKLPQTYHSFKTVI